MSTIILMEISFKAKFKENAEKSLQRRNNDIASNKDNHTSLFLPSLSFLIIPVTSIGTY